MKERVLVVDDDAAIRRSLERILGPAYDVVVAANVASALEAMETSDVRIALIDIHLHEADDGYALCQRIKRRWIDTDVILITGSVSQPDQKLYRSLEEGAFYFLFKPFERRVLRALVDRAMELQRERRAKESYASALAADLERARAFQQSLIPSGGLIAAGWTVAGAFRPCDALGGDFYFWLVERDGSVSFAMADVVGHGVGAAMYAGMLRSTIDAARRIDAEPERLIREVLRGVDFLEDNRFATLFYGVLYADGRLRYVNAGHPAALHVKADGQVETFGATGLFLTAAFPDHPRPVREVRLEPGARLIACTDGVLETQNSKAEEFGPGRLERAARESNRERPAEVVDRLLRRLDDHRDGRPLTDDVSLLVVERA